MSSKMIIVNNLSKKFSKVKSQTAEFPTLRDQLLQFGRRSHYEEFWALRDLNFEVAPGKVLGVIGANGAGKSTLFKIISQITKPTQGQVILNGRVSSLLEVGTGFHPELSGRENIFLNGAILGMRQNEIRVHFEEIVAFAGVADFIDQPVKHYSSGMYMRLAFSIAAHLTSEIMIIDEVLAVGDTAFQKQCLAKTKQLVRDEGRTVLLVSHNLASIQDLADQCLWLDHGQILALGAATSVIAKYKHSLLK